MARETRGAAAIRELPTFLPVALTSLVLLALAVGENGDAGDLALASLTVLLTQLLPGAVVWRAVRPAHGWWAEDLAVGLAVGAALAVAAQLLALATGVPLLAGAGPVVVAALLMGVRGTRSRVLGVRCAPLPVWWGTLAVVPAVVVLWVSERMLSSTKIVWSGWGRTYIDQPYHLALLGELAHRFPPDYPQVAGEPLQYHWFAHAWMAQIGTVSGASLDQVLLRFSPVVLSVALPLVVAVVAVRLSGLAVAGPLAAAFAFVALSLDLGAFSSGWTPFALQSPTQSLGALLLAATLALLVLRWRGEVGWGSLPVLLLLLVVGGGVKGTVLPVLLLGCLVATAAVAVADRSRLRKVGTDTVITAGVLLLLMRLLFGSGEGGLWLTPFTSLARLVAPRFGIEDPGLATGLSLTVLTLLVAVVPLFVLLVERSTRRDPAPWLLLGTAVAAYGALVVFRHSGQSQIYFVKTAEVAVAVGAGWGLARLWTGRSWRLLGGAALLGIVLALGTRRAGSDAESLVRSWLLVLVFLVLVSVVAIVAGVLVRRRDGVAAPVVTAFLATACGAAALAVHPAPSLPASEVTAGSVDAFAWDQVSAARFVRDHSDPDDVVMSNRHCRRPPKPERTCDARRFFVAAYTERPVLVEGWAYSAPARDLVDSPADDPTKVPFWDQPLLELNDGFYVDPSAEAAGELYDRGVRWVYVDHTAPYDEAIGDHAIERLRTPNATVYELTRP